VIAWRAWRATSSNYKNSSARRWKPRPPVEGAVPPDRASGSMARMDTMSLKGKLLVANPALEDPNFDRTVVLVLEHHDEGAVGVILNRPSQTSVEEVLPSWAAVAAQPAVVFVGGPVSPGSAIGLGCGRLPPDDGDGF